MASHAANLDVKILDCNKRGGSFCIRPYPPPHVQQTLKPPKKYGPNTKYLLYKAFGACGKLMKIL